MSTTTAAAPPAKKRGAGLMQGMQKVGRSLQLPVAVLPAAAILLRLGQDDATKPFLVIPIGLCFAAVYYAVFRFVITKFDLPTPGREPDDEIDAATG